MSDKKNNDVKLELWNNLLRTSLKIPGARIDRVKFLKSQLNKHVSDIIMKKAIESRPALAGIPQEKIDDLASSCIGWHTVQVSSLSFVAGLPGGWWIAGTIPADLAQFYYHVIVLSQKLAYLYGWPEFLGEDEDADDETILRLTLFIGVMMGATGATKVLNELAERFSKEVLKRLPQQALTKYGFYNVTKQIAKWLGIQITKSTFARTISKIIPILGGVLSAGLSVAFYLPMANRLKDHLKKLSYAHKK